MWSQTPSEAVSDVLNFKIFLGEHALRPPSLSMLPLATISPLLTENPVQNPALPCYAFCIMGMLV